MGGEREKRSAGETSAVKTVNSVEETRSKTAFIGGGVPPVTSGFDAHPKQSASDRAFGTALQMRSSHQVHSDAIQRMHVALTLAERDAASITQVLIPSYKNARDARNVDSVAELGGRLVAVFTRMNGANAAVDELHKSVRHESSKGSSVDQELTDFELQQYVDTNAPELARKVSQASILAMVAMVPHEFQGHEVAGVAPVPNVDGPPELLRARLAGELDRTLNMLIDMDEITRLVFAAGGKVDRNAHEAARTRLFRWASRPIDLAFLKAALGPIWNLLDATATTRKPSEELEAAAEQATHTGWLGDTGEFTIDDADTWLRLGGQENAAIVLRKLYTADPETRARLLEQMRERKLLHKFCSSFGWEPVKELHDSIVLGAHGGHSEVKTILQSYFLGGKDKFGPRLGEEWESHNNSLHHHLGRVPGVGGALNFVADLATFGFNSSYGKARDQYTSGQMSEADYSDSKRHIVNRTVAMAFVSIVTGGAADKFVRSGAASVTTLRAIGAGFAGGSVGSVAGLATSDAYNVYVSGQQESFSSPEAYIKTALVGGALGGALGGVLNGVSSRTRSYVPEEAAAMDEAANVSASQTPYRNIENPRVASAASRAGMETGGLSDTQLGLMEAADMAIAKGDLHTAVQIGDDLVRSGLPKDAVSKFETALAEASGKTSPEAYREPTARLPNGTPTTPSAYGGDLYYGTNEIAPDSAFHNGLPGRGPNTNLHDHVNQNGDSAFRGTTRMPLTPDREGGAGAWAGEDGWVYRIDGTPSWDVNAKLQGRIQKSDGSFGDSPLPAEHEQAVLANIPKERIVGAYKMNMKNGRLELGPFTKNPNYQAPK